MFLLSYRSALCMQMLLTLNTENSTLNASLSRAPFGKMVLMDLYHDYAQYELWRKKFT